jgi:hypothetical protein
MKGWNYPRTESSSIPNSEVIKHSLSPAASAPSQPVTDPIPNHSRGISYRYNTFRIMVSTTLTRPVSLLVRFMQWSSAVIVMGITSYFINKWPHGQHTIYWEVIVC